MLLELKGVNTYYGKSHVLRDVSLHIEQGEVVVLLGRNGAGRSTTLKTIMGIVPPGGGEILFKGEKINGLDAFRIARKGMAYVPEERRIFGSLTVLDNLKMAMIYGKKGEWTIEKIYKALPRLEERKYQVARGLSGGEKQMLTIARALVANPDIVLLDEPLEGLSPIIAQSIEEIINEIKKSGQTILLVEQNVRFALRVANRGFILNDGHIVAEGAANELLENSSLIKRYLAV
ncbi:ABC transporter ATP-binding protein [Ferviditalea candida]|uniref:ABC transporter ATP-binding protein n=1 Tax=Ferviditalea candida TaxID=3108399 RepID=A0ABU5ZJJ2_9BACL|nr:ABC transporter ATP-binding protein [Paenibacillaceae bacterium T2]